MRSIGVVTTSRADYGIYLPILHRVMAHDDLRLMLFVAGMHLSPEFGHTVGEIESDGFPIAERVELLLSSDSPEGISKSMGLGLIGYAQAFARSRPDILVVLGDRFEMHAAALAALPFRLPLAHIHGGEVSEGAIDDALRHSITKLSHLHFTSTPAYARRVRQLGEEPWRITVSGAPSLDNLTRISLLTRAELEQRVRLRLDPPPLLVTFHPVTLEFDQTEWQVAELLAAVSDVAESGGYPIIFTQPNADTGGRIATRLIERFVAGQPRAVLTPNLGTQAYFSVMARAAVMIGNSSSGIIEAASFGLPVVNIGTRQRGRVRGQNVVDSGHSRDEIAAQARNVLLPSFRQQLDGLTNPYGSGRAAEVIVDRLRLVALDETLTRKRFVDLPVGEVIAATREARPQ